MESNQPTRRENAMYEDYLNDDDRMDAELYFDDYDDDYYGDEYDDGPDDYDDSMDGDFDTAMESAGWGTDEQYGYYGDD